MFPTVFVVDDDPDMRDSLLTLLRVLEIPAHGFASAEEFQDYYNQQPGCLVLDVRLQGKSGIELYSELLQRGKRLPVIFITAHASINTAVAALRTGAIDFLEKPFDREILSDRITRALRIDASWRENEARYKQLDAVMQELSATDRETLALLVQGEPNKVMAAKLLITERAVEMRRQRLMRRLNVDSLAELLELTITHRVLAAVRELERDQSIVAN